MNKKIFATALFAVAAFVSTIASAQITYDNSATAGGYAQTDNALVAAGGGSVRANDLIITVGSATDIPADAEIIIRVPAGLNFDGEPSYLVTPATPTQGLTLKDGTTFGDPTLDDPGIQLFDTNGDGGMDRALVVAGAAGQAGDMLTISANLTATAGATVGADKLASIIVNAGLAVTQPIADVVATLNEPIQGSSGTALSSVDQSLNPNIGTSTATIAITIPKGTLNGKTITLKPQSGVTWAGTTSTITVVGVRSPVDTFPLTPTSTVGAATSTATVSFAVDGGHATTGLASDVQVVLSVNRANSLAGAIGTKGVTIAGTAGISGTAPLFNVLQNGSDATLTSGAEATEIVAGSTAQQTLPSIDIVENFPNDAASATTPTITITGGAGLTFGSTATITVNNVAVTTSTVTTNASQMSVLTLTMPVFGPTSSTLTIKNIQATAASTASGNLTAKVGSPGSPDKTTAPGDTLVVAVAVPLGDVTVTGPATPGVTGPGGAPLTSTVTLTEETYGALSIANKTLVQDAFIRITPSSNGTINAAVLSTSGYPAGASPTFTVNPCVAETGVTTGAFLCEIGTESSSIVPTTSTISLAINIEADADAAIGSTLDVTLDGNAGVDGSATLANVGVATTATKGVVPDLTPGETEAQSLAQLTITENFSGAISSGSFRLIAPTGVTFNDVSGITLNAGAATGTIAIADTFSPSDTLVIPINGTPTVTFTPVAVIGPNVSEWVSFNITDGDINGNNKTGITNESVMLAYADGTLEAIDAGDDISVNVNFSATNTIEGGLADYTATSSNTSIATVDVSGNQLTVTGKAVGSATIDVVDELGGPLDTVVVTVSAGATQPASENGTKPSSSAATFTAGASTDGGDTFATEFTTADDVTIVATVNVDPADQGTDGEVHVAIKSDTADGVVFAYLNEAGDFEAWDLSLGDLGAAVVAEPLGATYNLTIFSGQMAAGTYRIALAYSTEDGDFAYTGKAIVITVTE